MEDLNVAIRLKGFIDAAGLTHSQFADRCGIPRPSLSQILSGRNKKISDVMVGQIHKSFPELSVLWLLFGEGSMLVNSNEGASEDAVPGGLFDDSLDFTGNQSEFGRSENVSALTHPAIVGQNSDSKDVAIDMRIADLQKQIDKLRKNPRRVSQITVYYDDSTFETFYPKR